MAVKSYESMPTWRVVNDALPKYLRIVGPHPAIEEWYDTGKFNVHVDRWNTAAARATVILVHGAGGNGRMLGPYARICNELGYNVIAPDLPGYGLTQQKCKSSIRYEDWRAVLAEIVVSEAAAGLPIVLLGASMGGMLAYDVAARTRVPKALIATCLLEPTDPQVRLSMVRWPFMAKLIEPLLLTAPTLTDKFPIIMKLASNMSAITNDKKLTNAIIADPSAGGNWMPAGFLRTFLTAEPEVLPEEFDVCPVLLAHPAIDRWTDVSVSLQFLKQLTHITTRVAMLEDGGHFPIEAKAIEQLTKACAGFISEVIG